MSKTQLAEWNDICALYYTREQVCIHCYRVYVWQQIFYLSTAAKYEF